jgi:peroxiredoxin
MQVRLSRAVLLLVILGVSVPASSPANEPDGFGASPPHTLVAERLTTRDLSRWLDVLEARVTAGALVAAQPAEAKATLAEFTHRVQAGVLSRDQEALVLARLEALALSRPELGALIGEASYAVKSLTIGKVAPDIEGLDLDGRPFRLSDFRGKVVVLTFSGEWCGICRSEYPYQRLLLELYANWPFARVGVESGAHPAAPKRAKAHQRHTYRSWWDAGRPPAKGSIARSWSVSGWPTTYVLDGRGVIRFVDLRKEDLLKGVRQLLGEQ